MEKIGGSPLESASIVLENGAPRLRVLSAFSERD